jgi:hypothetical protein
MVLGGKDIEWLFTRKKFKKVVVACVNFWSFVNCGMFKNRWIYYVLNFSALFFAIAVTILNKLYLLLAFFVLLFFGSYFLDLNWNCWPEAEV